MLRTPDQEWPPTRAANTRHTRAGPGSMVRRLLCGAALAAASLLYLAPEAYGLAERSPFIQLVAFRPYLAAAQLGLVVAALLVRRRWWPAGLVVGGLTAVLLAAVIPRALPSAAPDVPAAGTLSVLSFNVLHGQADVNALAAAVGTYRPDVVVLPEAGTDFRRRLDPLMKPMGYRSRVSLPDGDPDADGIVVLTSSRLGRVDAAEVDVGARLRWIRLTGGGLGDVRVVAVHTASPVPPRQPEWAPEIGALAQWCRLGGPDVIVGDVNATLDHAPLRAAVAGCTDAASDRGRGLVPTWPTSLPRWLGVQIDHVFAGGGIRASGVWVLDLPGSDHRAVLARLVVPPAVRHS